MADEGAFLELLVANERVGRLLDVLVDPTQRSRHKSTIMQLQSEVQRGSSYVEEAHRAGAIQILTNLLARTTPGSEELRADEAVMDAVSRIIAVCSGPMAAGGKVSCFSYGPVSIRIREGALGDGLGAQVWAVAHILCRELLRHPEVVASQQVLEIGSGTGLCGIMAAKLGAAQVLLTDHEQQVLVNLRACMHLNASNASSSSSSADAPPSETAAKTSSHLAEVSQGTPATGAAGSPGVTTASHPLATPSHALEDLSDEEFDQQPRRHGQPSGQPSPSGRAAGAVPFTDAELFDDAESVEDFDLTTLLSPRSSSLQQQMRGRQEAGAASGSSSAADGTSTSWEVDNMAVRLLDWQESHDAMERGGSSAAAAAEAGRDPSGTGTTGAGVDAPPGVSLDTKFPVILGNEVMYEPAHARLVAACLHHRLAPGGRALLCCAVRDQGVFDTFRDSCTARGLRYRAVQVQPEEERDVGGIRGRERDYEGGYLLMAVDHSSSPAQDWHRDDFQVVQ